MEKKIGILEETYKRSIKDLKDEKEMIKHSYYQVNLLIIYHNHNNSLVAQYFVEN